MADDVLGKDGFVIRDRGRWAEEKLYYLGRYLKIMSVGMSKIEPVIGIGKPLPVLA